MENNYYRKWAERIGERFIPEAEFADATAARRDALAAEIAGSGLSYNHIGKGTRLGRKTIARAANGMEVRQDAHDRIHYYLQAVADRIAPCGAGAAIASPEHTQGFHTTTTYDGQTIETK